MYPSLRYVLLFPTGQLGWHHKLPYNALEEGNGDANNKYITMMEHYCYHLHIHPLHYESIYLFLSGKLFQEFVCEIWAVTEQNCLSFLKHNQKKLRSEIYQGLVDAMAANADASMDELGKRFILPSSFSGSTCNMQQHL